MITIEYRGRGTKGNPSPCPALTSFGSFFCCAEASKSFQGDLENFRDGFARGFLRPPRRGVPTPDTRHLRQNGVVWRGESSPSKANRLRRSRWRERYGFEQTRRLLSGRRLSELDAKSFGVCLYKPTSCMLSGLGCSFGKGLAPRSRLASAECCGSGPQPSAHVTLWVTYKCALPAKGGKP